jgi:hypothetical protein
MDPNLRTENSDVSLVFFGQPNVNGLQEAIRYSVFRKTGKLISKQSEKDLLIVMRSIFLQYGQTNVGLNTKERVREINRMVIDVTIPLIIAEIKTYVKYLKDIATLPVPLERSENMSSAGTRSIGVSLGR